MTTEQIKEIAAANEALLRSTDRLLTAADDLRHDKGRLLDLLKQVTPTGKLATRQHVAKQREGSTDAK